jgi:hypothetical protein
LSHLSRSYFGPLLLDYITSYLTLLTHPTNQFNPPSFSTHQLNEPTTKTPNTHTMATELPTTNGHSAQDGENNFAVKAGLARMLKGGVIMDVVNAEQVSLTQLQLPQPRVHSMPKTVTNMATGTDSRRGRCLRRYGPRARPRRHSIARWRSTYERPQDDQGDHGHSDHSRHGEGANWTFC